MARILIVDEDEYMRIALQMAVSDRFDAEIASSSEEAIQLAAGSKFDIAAIDIHTTGLDMIAQLHRISPGIAVLAVLDAGRIRTAIEAMSRGAIYYLFKPFDLDNLIEVIDAILERPSPSRRVIPADENNTSGITAISLVMQSFLTPAIFLLC